MSSDPPVKRRRKRDTERGNSSQHYLIATCFLSGVVAVLVLPLDKVRFGGAWMADTAGQSAPAEPEDYTELLWEDSRPSRGHVGGMSRVHRDRTQDELESDFSEGFDGRSSEDFAAMSPEDEAEDPNEQAEPLFGDRRLAPREPGSRSRKRTVSLP